MRRYAFWWFAVFALLCPAMGGAAPAPDPDADGIPGEMEEILGTDLARAERLAVVYEEKTRAEGERVPGTDNYTPARDITRVLFGNVAGDRYLWAVEFAEAYPAAGSNLIFYLNADDDVETGRKDAQGGTDLMVWVSEGGTRATRYRPDGTMEPGPAPRAVVVGNRVYLCLDLHLHQEGGKAAYRMMLLSETTQPHQAVDNTPFFPVRGDGPSERKKPVGLSDLTESQGVIPVWGIERLRRIHDDAATVVLPIEECAFEGFEQDVNSEYRESSAVRRGTRGSIRATVPRAGSFYPAFTFYDGPGAEKIGVFVNGERRGIAVAGHDDNRQVLFALSQPVPLKPGDAVELRNLTPEGAYRTEDLLLLAQRPEPGKRTYAIQHVAAIVRPGADGKPEASITFITNWDVIPRVQYGATARYGREAVGRADLPLNNHRVVIPGLAANTTYYYRVVATGDDGKPVATPGATFSTSPPRYPAGTVARRRVPLKLAGPVAGGDPWPVTSGVPLPQGEVFSEANVRLLGAGSKEIPCQARATGRWPDGSIRWVLLDFVAAGPEGYVLEYGSQVRRLATTRLSHRVQVTRIGRATVVSTGPLRLQFDQRSGLFAQAWRDANADGRLSPDEALLDAERPARMEVAGLDGVTYTSLAAPDEVVVEESGPVRACVRLSGAFRDGERSLFCYTLRVHAWAGLPLIRLQATLENDVTRPRFTSIKSAVLHLPFARAGTARVSLGGVAETPLADGVLGVVQDFDNHLYSAIGATGQIRGGRAPGWATWESGGRRVACAVRDFWQLYPKSLAATPEGLQVGLCPPLRPDEYADKKGTVEEYRTLYYLMDEAYKLAAGVTKTHDILLSFDAAGKGPAGAALAGFANRRPLLVAPPEWYRETQVFGSIALAGDHAMVRQYDASTERAFGDYLRNRERNHEYGMLNYGDWWGERQINWGNIEYDTQHAFFLHFARTGDPRCFFAGEEAELHNRDVDTIHHSADAWSVGRAYAHSIGHVGGYFAQSPVPGQGSVTGGFTVSHTWVEGHLGHYFLTGDRRSLETAEKIAATYNAYNTRNYDFHNCREPGWHLILATAMYRATGDPFHLNAARIIVERVLERQTPDGGWRRQLVPGHCPDLPRHHGNAGFMVGVLMSGLKYYHQATGDPRVATSLARAAKFVIRDMWVPESKGFRYTSCPNTSASRGLSFLFAEGIGYAWRLTRDPQLRRITLDGLGAGIESMNGMGKSFSQQTRSTPLSLHDIVPMLKIVDNVTAQARARNPAPGEGAAITFDGAGTQVRKGTAVSWVWDFGDGARGEGKRVRHTYAKGGSYTARLTVTTGSGETATAEAPVHVPPAWLLSAKPGQAILVEAEDLANEGGGKCQLREGRVNASGKMITYWHAEKGHWLEWKVRLPADGRYRVVLKYCTDTPDTRRDFRVDGGYPHPGLQEMRFPRTGGFATGADDWVYHTLGDAPDRPYLLDLKAGEHTVRMANLNDGMGLDFLVFVREE